MKLIMDVNIKVNIEKSRVAHSNRIPRNCHII